MNAADAAICPTIHAPPIEDLYVLLVLLITVGATHPQDLPTTPVLKLAKHIANRSPGSKDPQRDDDNEETNEEHDEDDTLEERKVLSGESVERDGKDSNGHGHEGSLPGSGQSVQALQAFNRCLQLTKP
jgi:hypothetical protein